MDLNGPFQLKDTAGLGGMKINFNYRTQKWPFYRDTVGKESDHLHVERDQLDISTATHALYYRNILQLKIQR